KPANDVSPKQSAPCARAAARIQHHNSMAASRSIFGLGLWLSAARSEHEFAVGKRRHSPVRNHDLEVADCRRGSVEETGMDSLLGRCVFAAALQPGLEVVGLADDFSLLDAKPGLFDKCRPRSLGVD